MTVVPGLDRRFLGWERPVLHSVASELIEAVSPQGPLDLSGVQVVLPGARAGRRLKEILLEQAEAVHRALLPPVVTTVGALPEKLYFPALALPGPIVEHQAWARALEGLEDADLAVLRPPVGFEPDPATDGEPRPGPRSTSQLELEFQSYVVPSARAGRVPSSLVRTVRELHHAVAAAGVDFLQVATICRSGFPFSDERRWSVLSRAQEAYLAALEVHGYRDRASARAKALDDGDVASSSELWVAASPDLPPVVRRFVEAVGRRSGVRILVAAPEELSDRFDELGCVVPEAWAAAESHVPDEMIRSAAGPGEQADVVVGRLFELEGEVAADEITIGVPDPDVIPYLVERLGEASVAARDAAGIRLERTGPFRLLNAIARHLERGEADTLATLARHPGFERAVLARSHRPPAEITGVLDRYQSLHLQATFDREALPSGGERAGGELTRTLQPFVEAASELLDPLAGRQRLKTWAPRIVALLSELLEDDTPHSGAREAEAFAERVGEVLEGFRGVPDELDPVVPGYRALRLILDEVRNEVAPRDPDESAVELLGWLELAMDDAPEVVVTGMNEPHVPESVTSDPFLPHSLRERLGLLDNRGRWARDLSSLRIVLETRKNRGGVRLVVGRRSAVGDPLQPSRLLFAAPPEAVADRVLRLLGRESTELGSESGQIEPVADRSVPSRAFSLPPEPVIAAPAPPETVRVTAFRGLLTDPYRYALEHVLGLDRVDDEAREMDPMSFGTLAHRVLQGFGGSSVAGSTDPVEIQRELTRQLERETRGRFGSHALPAVRPQIAQLLTRLRAFARWQAEWVGRGWVIRGVEVTPPGEGAPFLVDASPILLRGVIDRIDENTRTGEWCIFDYKTGDRPRTPEEMHRAGRGEDRRWVDLQLPLYRVLAASLEDEEGAPLLPLGRLESVGLGYILLPRETDRVGASFADWSPEDLGEAEEEARDVVRLLRRNRFEYDPNRSAIRPGHPLAPVVGAGVLNVRDSVSPIAGEGSSPQER